MKLGTQVGLGPGHIVLDRDPAPLPQRGAAPTKFSAHICCGQMSAWIKMPLGMEVGLSPSHFVLDGDPVFPLQQRGGARPPILRVEVRISKLDRKCGALPVVANFVALEQQIILVKTRSESV